jgi:hypothetical protein
MIQPFWSGAYGSWSPRGTRGGEELTAAGLGDGDPGLVGRRVEVGAGRGSHVDARIRQRADARVVGTGSDPGVGGACALIAARAQAPTRSVARPSAGAGSLRHHEHARRVTGRASSRRGRERGRQALRLRRHVRPTRQRRRVAIERGRPQGDPLALLLRPDDLAEHAPRRAPHQRDELLLVPSAEPDRPGGGAEARVVLAASLDEEAETTVGVGQRRFARRGLQQHDAVGAEHLAVEPRLRARLDRAADRVGAERRVAVGPEPTARRVAVSRRELVVGAARGGDGTEEGGAARVEDLEAAGVVAILRKADPDSHGLSSVARWRG